MSRPSAFLAPLMLAALPFMPSPTLADTPLTLAKSELPTGLHQALLYSLRDVIQVS